MFRLDRSIPTGIGVMTRIEERGIRLTKRRSSDPRFSAITVLHVHESPGIQSISGREDYIPAIHTEEITGTMR